MLDGLGDVADPFSDELREREKLLPYRTALELIHRPSVIEETDQAKHTLRMHEALVLQIALAQQRQAVHEMEGTSRRAVPGGLLERFDQALPFERTSDQLTVGDEIAAELVEEHPMNRLVQGEVGSGKTLVALRAMLQVAESGGQAALIAPTEVLAAQHLRSIARMLGPELQTELMPTLLTGQMGAAERRRAALRVASGQARVVVGTHALLSDKTTFADLGLVVVDEQHRFGVEQREALRGEGRHTAHAGARPRRPFRAHGCDDRLRRDLDVVDDPHDACGPRGHPDVRRAGRRTPGMVAAVWERAGGRSAQGLPGVRGVLGDRRRR